MKKLLPILAIFTINIIASNAQIRVTDIKPNKENIFPFVTTPSKIISENINQYLSVAYLENADLSTNDPFQFVKKNSTFYGYNHFKNSIPVITLSIDSEFCGSYCEGATEYVNFDQGNGQLITLKDLLEPNKVEALNKILNQKVRKEIQQFIQQIPDLKNLKKDDIEFYTNQRSIYEECLEYVDIYKLYDYGYKYHFSNDSIYFERGRCSNRAMRALDDLGRFVIGFSKKEIHPYLSTYGNNLYTNQPRKMTDISEKIFTGKVGNYPIKGILDKYSRETYWYEKTKKLIKIDKQIDDEKFKLNENDNNNKHTATFLLKRHENKLIGTWNKVNSNNYLPVEINFKL
ncbi:hypothetical protein HX096_06350 [Empedobacter falsenii]|uniref:hypothetical protein n=1 Tax=Empedobacter falsenii TaxID=343874 RepID=UPI0025770416|nr:hypothetical protein [Empedobacter falsenii]MDM1547482.1 hypothetical protein [Empedobacter falsenii]